MYEVPGTCFSSGSIRGLGQNPLDCKTPQSWSPTAKAFHSPILFETGWKKGRGPQQILLQVGIERGMERWLGLELKVRSKRKIEQNFNHALRIPTTTFRQQLS
jgi:hypothetical protein